MERVKLKVTERDKKDFSDAFNDCWSRLKVNNYYVINDKIIKNEEMSEQSVMFSKEMYDFMLSILEKISKSQGSEWSCDTETILSSVKQQIVSDDFGYHFYKHNNSFKNNDNESLDDDDDEDEDMADDDAIEGPWRFIIDDEHEENNQDIHAMTTLVNFKEDDMADDAIEGPWRFIIDDEHEENNQDIHAMTTLVNFKEDIPKLSLNKLEASDVVAPCVTAGPGEQGIDEFHCNINKYDGTLNEKPQLVHPSESLDGDMQVLLQNKIKKEHLNINVKQQYNVDKNNCNIAETFNEKSPLKKNYLRKNKIFSYKDKVKIVKLALENPTWSARKLKTEVGFHDSIELAMNNVRRWKQELLEGGTSGDKMDRINSWVYEKYTEYIRENKEAKITTNLLHQWGIEAKNLYFPCSSGEDDGKPTKLKFNATTTWIQRFAKRHNIIIHRKPLPSQAHRSNNGNFNGTGVKINKNTRVNSIHSSLNSKKIAGNIRFAENKIKKVKRYTLKRIFASYNEKVRIVELSRRNPHWTVDMLRKNSGCIFLRADNGKKQIIKNWEKQIDNFWSEKRNKVDSFVFDNCIEYQEREKRLTDDLLRHWASDGVKIYWPHQQNPEDMIFKSKLPIDWLSKFKTAYGIVGASTNLKILESFFKREHYNNDQSSL